MAKVYRPRIVDPTAIIRWLKGAIVLTLRSSLVWVLIGVALVRIDQLPVPRLPIVLDLGALLLTTTAVIGCCFWCVLISGLIELSFIEERGKRRTESPLSKTYALIESTAHYTKHCVFFVCCVVIVMWVNFLIVEAAPSLFGGVTPESTAAPATHPSPLTHMTVLDFIILMFAMHALLASRIGLGRGVFTFLLARTLDFGSCRANRLEQIGVVYNLQTLAYAHLALLGLVYVISVTMRLIGIHNLIVAAVILGVVSNFLWLCFKDIFLHEDEEPTLFSFAAKPSEAV